MLVQGGGQGCLAWGWARGQCLLGAHQAEEALPLALRCCWPGLPELCAESSAGKGIRFCLYGAGS